MPNHFIISLGNKHEKRVRVEMNRKKLEFFWEKWEEMRENMRKWEGMRKFG